MRCSFEGAASRTGWCAQAERSTIVSANLVRAFLTGPSGSGSSAATASSAQRRASVEGSAGDVVVAQLGDGARRSPRRRPSRRRPASTVALDAGEQLGGGGIRLGGATQVEQRQGRHAGAQVGARHLAGLLDLGRQVDDVVDELEGDADPLAELLDRAAVLLRSVARR